MKFLFASDSFKGTLSSPKTAKLLTQAAREIFPDCVCDSISSRWRRRNNRSSTFSSQRNNNSLESARTFMGRIDMQLWYAG